MTLGEKIIFGAAVVVVAIVAFFGVQYFSNRSASLTTSFGAVGNLLAENYINYVRQNGGINTNDPVTVGNTLTATTIAATTLTVSGALTYTTGVQTLNGITITPVRQSWTSGTSTPCSFQTPNATTTGTVFVTETTATSSTIDWSIGTSTSAFATSSSMIKNQRINANQLGTMAFDPGTNTGIYNPNTWVVLGPDTGTVNTTGAFNSIVAGGICGGIFQSTI